MCTYFCQIRSSVFVNKEGGSVFSHKKGEVGKIGGGYFNIYGFSKWIFLKKKDIVESKRQLLWAHNSWCKCIFILVCQSTGSWVCCVSLCVCVCVCFLCEIKSEHQQKTTLRVRPQYIHSVYPTPFMLGGGGGGGNWPPTKFPKKGGGLIGSQFLEGGCWERRSVFFQERRGMQFLQQQKISKISNV